MVASSREISFARQFFRMNLFIIRMQKNFGDTLPKCLRREIALNSAPVTNGNSASLLRNDDRNRVRFFSNTETGAVT